LYFIKPNDTIKDNERAGSATPGAGILRVLAMDYKVGAAFLNRTESSHAGLRLLVILKGSQNLFDGGHFVEAQP
jgi:hypothetical protein